LATGSIFGSLFGGGGKGTLCIDIGSNSVKFVKMEGGRVTDYGFKEIGEAFDVPSILRELVKDYKPGEVFSFVSGPSVSLRQAPFPKMGRRELKDAIMLRLEKYSPFTIDEAILDFKALGPVREAGAVKDNVMVVAARKDIVSDHISTLRKAGLEPSGIGVIPFALQATVKKYGKMRPDETICLLDIGAEFTDMVFMKGERLDLARTITTAGNALMSETCEKLNNLTILTSLITRKSPPIEKASRDAHVRIIDSLLEQDDIGSEQAMRDHLRETCRNLVEHFYPGMLNGSLRKET